MSAVEITPQGLSISQLRAEATRTADAKQARRILAIAMVLDGHSRLVAAQAGGMERQTLRDWVIRYNEGGVAGLADRPRPGRPAALSDGQRAEVAQWVQSGHRVKKLKKREREVTRSVSLNADHWCYRESGLVHYWIYDLQYQRHLYCTYLVLIDH